MNRSEFERLARESDEQESRSMMVLGALVAVLLAGLLGTTLASWFEVGAAQIAQVERIGCRR